jgi:transcriptional regulator with PAS, ATPase and Fis domain
MIGESLQITTIRRHIAQIARFDTHVLITGETGTGKELAAEMLHSNSPRSSHSFVSFNCAAIPESLIESELFGHEKGVFTGADSKRMGLFAAADGGTIFLDEIGEMSPSAQSKILRVFENKQVQRLGAPRAHPVDVRIVAATNQNLEELVAHGRFRRDLYYRLNVARVHLPPLRERRADIPQLVTHFINLFNRQMDRHVIGLEPEVHNSLCEFGWPGNVRELKNVLEATFLAVESSMIKFSDLPASYQAKFAHMRDAPFVEREKLISMLLATNWNKSEAAKQLHWSRMTLYRKMTKYSIGQPALKAKA